MCRRKGPNFCAIRDGGHLSTLPLPKSMLKM